jgi:hypothetical protein
MRRATRQRKESEHLIPHVRRRQTAINVGWSRKTGQGVKVYSTG